jgi:Zn-dependent membrane protease YugP
MHPIVVIVPILAAAFGPRLWASRLLRRHDVDDGRFLPANDLARRLLDDNGLDLVRVEVTDLGDHYDPLARTVRLSRGHFDHRSLTAATTVAHEVGHALQDAAGYWPFRLHLALGRLSRITGDVGTVLLIGVPVAAMIAPGPVPPLVIGAAAAGMLGTSLAAQLAALPSELNASFGRALPLLRECCIDDAQLRDARRILLACSLTYVSSSLNPLMVLWPWIGGLLRRPLPALRADHPAWTQHPVSASASQSRFAPSSIVRATTARSGILPRARPAPPSAPIPEWPLLKAAARPLVRGWLRMTGDY